jgi:uncharacterized protein YjbI with pentapeptide repeats
MIEERQENNQLAEAIPWIAVNSVVIGTLSFSLYFGSDLNLTSSITDNAVIAQILSIVANISIVGAGILLALCQWIFLRHIIPPITGGGWAWVISGVVSSMGGLFVLPFAILNLGDYPKEMDYLFFSVLVISTQIIFLSFVQGLILNANKYKGVTRWILVHIVGYGLAVVITFYLWNDQVRSLIMPVVVLMTIVTAFSGREFIRTRASREDKKVESQTQQAISKTNHVYFVQANLENRDLHDQNFDGVDFRKANLRMANLEKISGEPAQVRKMGPGCFSLILTILSEGRGVEGMNYAFVKNEMKSTDFSGADLTGAKLNQAKLREANFTNAILRNADMFEASLVSASFNEADLRNADLSHADLSNAILYKTNLEGADLTAAKLQGTDFEGANLKNAILRNTDLRGVRYLDRADLSGANLTGALMPEKK